MASKEQESGLEELLRLSQRIAQKAENTAKQEARKKKDLAEKKQVMHGLREITFSMALEQLKIVSAEPYIFARVKSFKNIQDTTELRKLIADLSSKLEGDIRKVTRSNPALAPIERSMKTLTVLIDLFFSLN